MTADLAALLARLGEAKEGTVELSEEIARHLGWTPRDGVWYPPGSTGYPQPCAPNAPRYTTSIDAALLLVPEGWQAGFEMPGVHDTVQQSEAWCWPFHSDWRPDWQNGDEGYRSHQDGTRAIGATPALALVIAFLRAQGESAKHG
jgi:hypothetical protein